MARTWILALGLALAALTLGCRERDRIVAIDAAPFRVDGVRSITGDDRVTIEWRENQESDIAYYKIYRNGAPTGTFSLVGQANSPPFADLSVSNGVTYYYAVAAVDDAGQESAELSYENVFDTPRPEGTNLTLTNANTNDALSGLDFSDRSRQASANVQTDLYYAVSGGAYLVYAVGGTLIQDTGYIALRDVDFAPPAGWSADGVVEAIPGHSYIVLTADNHYAKFEVVSRDASAMTIDWAYQIDPDNPELARKLP
jgi:hypothetical protein